MTDLGLKNYPQDIKPLVDGTSLLLKDKEKFIDSLFGGYGFWRFFFQPWYRREYEETENALETSRWTRLLEEETMGPS